MKWHAGGFSVLNLLVYVAASSVLSVCLLQAASRLLFSVRMHQRKANAQTALAAGVYAWQKGVRSMLHEKEAWVLMNKTACVVARDQKTEGYEIIEGRLYQVTGSYHKITGWVRKTKSLVLDQLSDPHFTYVLSRKTPQKVQAVVLHGALKELIRVPTEWWSAPEGIG